MKKIVLSLIAILGPSSYLLGSSETGNKTIYSKGKRTNLLVMSSELDKKKPLAVSDYSGFVLRGDELFGGVSPNWAARFNFKSRKPMTWYSIEAPLSVPMLVSGNAVICATRNGEVYRFDVESGKLVWKTKLPSYASKKLVVIMWQ